MYSTYKLPQYSQCYFIWLANVKKQLNCYNKKIHFKNRSTNQIVSSLYRYSPTGHKCCAWKIYSPSLRALSTLCDTTTRLVCAESRMGTENRACKDANKKKIKNTDFKKWGKKSKQKQKARSVAFPAAITLKPQPQIWPFSQFSNKYLTFPVHFEHYIHTRNILPLKDTFPNALHHKVHYKPLHVNMVLTGSLCIM